MQKPIYLFTHQYDKGIMMWIRDSLTYESMTHFMGTGQSVADLKLCEWKQTSKTNVTGVDILSQVLASRFLAQPYTIDPSKENNTCLNFAEFSANYIAQISSSVL